MILEQLVNTLQTEVRVWVTERKPKTLPEAAKLADDYLSARKQNGSRLGQERKFDQKAAVDGKKTVSESSSKQESEPKGDDAPRTAVGKRSSRGEIRCFNCKETRPHGTGLSKQCLVWWRTGNARNQAQWCC